jgi:phenylpyruvate tautomerase PptA (4-oxalocrotonate tautomerase family)
LKTEGQKYKTQQKYAAINTGCDVQPQHSQSEMTAIPTYHLNKSGMRAAMSRKKSAVKTSECDSVAKINKKSGRYSIRVFISEVKSQHYVTVKKDQRSGLTAALAESFGLGFEHTAVNVQTVILLFH